LESEVKALDYSRVMKMDPINPTNSVETPTRHETSELMKGITVEGKQQNQQNKIPDGPTFSQKQTSIQK